MTSKRAIGAFAAAAVVLFQGEVQATVIDFNLVAPSMSPQILGSTYSQDGYTFTQSGGSGYFNYAGSPTLWNADGAMGDLIAFGNTTTTITNTLGRAYTFFAIGLTDATNSGFHSGFSEQIRFTFNHTSGPADVVTVTLAQNVAGLQTFLFDEHRVTSVAFGPLPSQEVPGMQFDNVGVSTGVPEPSTWTMILLAVAGLGLMHGRTRKRGTATAVG